ncbi:hypothetical protein Tsp_06398 [Trichinella spiralis]|uniref:hypothetical protein n=1 Tax=Trichinella spiralis TaxID=6334 RepID=UPI0001EFC2B6|nr:hypothetical protein Tsp_06398 [Trichinella spiralis]
MSHPELVKAVESTATNNEARHERKLSTAVAASSSPYSKPEVILYINLCSLRVVVVEQIFTQERRYHYCSALKKDAEVQSTRTRMLTQSWIVILMQMIAPLAMTSFIK